MNPQRSTVCLLSTGEEVLRGEILDSNNHWLARTLGERGFQVQLMLTAGDRRERLQGEHFYALPVAR